MATAPESFLCPIGNELMVDPVLIVETGHTYCRSCIIQWFEKNDTCPNANIPVVDKTIVNNFALHKSIEEYKQKQSRLEHDAAVVGDVHAQLIAAQRKVRHLENTVVEFDKVKEEIKLEKKSQHDITHAVKALKLQSSQHQQAQKSLFVEKTDLEKRINEINTHMRDNKSRVEQCQTSLRKHELTLEEGAKRITTLEQKLERIKSAPVEKEEEKEGEEEGKEEADEEDEHDDAEEEKEEADEEYEDDDDDDDEDEEFTPPSWKRSFKPSDGSQSTRRSPRGRSPSVSPQSNVRSSAGKRSTETSDPNRTASKDLTRKRYKISNDRPNMYTPIDRNAPTFCLCLQVEFGQMIACENERCLTPREWYHFACVNLTHTPDNWFCPECSTADNHRS